MGEHNLYSPYFFQNDCNHAHKKNVYISEGPNEGINYRNMKGVIKYEKTIQYGACFDNVYGSVYGV